MCKISGLFVNELSVDIRYSVLNKENLEQHFKMQLSQKRKIFSVLVFSKFRFNFEHFQIKDNTHSGCIFELMDSEKRG